MKTSRTSPIGKLTQSALQVRDSALRALMVLLQLFEGCAKGYFERVEGRTSSSRTGPSLKVSYLSNPDFGAGSFSVLAAPTVNLRAFGLRVWLYGRHQDPPILHRKEALLAAERLVRAKFERLTRLEAAKGVLGNASRIGMR